MKVYLFLLNAEVAELAYAYASEAYGFSLEGSTPSFRTKFCEAKFVLSEAAESSRVEGQNNLKLTHKVGDT